MSKNLPVPAPVKGMALIDAGTTLSFIDDTLASKLGINPTGRINSGGMRGSSVGNSYPVKLTILAGNQRWTFETTRALGVNIVSQGLIALIGRDFLSKGIMIYSGFMGIIDLGI